MQYKRVEKYLKYKCVVLLPHIYFLVGGSLDLTLELIHEGHDALAVDAEVGNALLTLHDGAVVLVQLRGVGHKDAANDTTVNEDALVEDHGGDEGQDGDVTAHGKEGLTPDSDLTGTSVEVGAGLDGAHVGDGGAGGDTAEHTKSFTTDGEGEKKGETNINNNYMSNRKVEYIINRFTNEKHLEISVYDKCGNNTVCVSGGGEYINVYV